MVNPFKLNKIDRELFPLNDPSKKHVALVDLDRTLCDNSRYYVPLDLNEYLQDPPNSYIYRIVTTLIHVPIVIISCRPKSAIEYSAKWLYNNGIFPMLILHRDDIDNREDHIIKEEMLLRDIFPTMYVKIAFDDKESIRQMYKKYGINCFHF